MNDGIRNRRIAEFLETLGSDSPTPGGGAAAAVTGASGAALIAMVANLTIDKAGYEEAWDRMREILPVVGAGRDELLELADRDAAAFDEVMAAFRMPKETDDEKAARRRAIQLAFEGAASVPLRVAERAAQMIDLGREAVTLGNDNAASDGLSAAYLLYAAVECAAANVLINAASLKDEDRKRELLSAVGRVRETARRDVDAAARAFSAKVG
ncbi:MAG TPA: cyclodeaminase/cyclohydrolase family protein [Actinomycetota bacterium]|nr:cyclodeaminase/cyclohydrolase family protein [Actinomycetota bacterium]